MRLFHLAAEILHAIEMGVFVPTLRCRGYPFKGSVLGVDEPFRPTSINEVGCQKPSMPAVQSWA